MLQLISFLLAFLFLFPVDANTNQPNIVVIVADDMGYHDVGFRGSPILTPNLDRLAKTGVVLENHIVSSICSPSRATLMTGRYPIHTGFWKGNLKPRQEYGLGLDETLLPEMLQRKGYTTHGVGKWHCGMYTWQHTPVCRGFDTFFGLFLGEQGYFTHEEDGGVDFREDYLDEDGNIVDKVRKDLRGQYNTDLFSSRSVELISNHTSNRPFFLYLAYTAPHIPMDVPEEYVTKYASHIPDERKRYAAMVSTMDDGIGRIVDALVKLGMMENTILVFTSDNGAYYEAHGSNFPLRGGKSSFLEGGVRALTFVHSPLLKNPGYTNTNLHHLSDWYTTFQVMAGDDKIPNQKPQLPLDGVNIWPSISEGQSCREEILYELRDPTKRDDDRGAKGRHDSEKYPINENMVSYRDDKSRYAQDFFVIRRRNWKLMTGTSLEMQGWSGESGMHDDYQGFTCGFKGGNDCHHALASGTFLFDLDADPREENNVAKHHPDIVEELMGRKQDFVKGIKLVGNLKGTKKAKLNGVWTPWVEL